MRTLNKFRKEKDAKPFYRPALHIGEVPDIVSEKRPQKISVLLLFSEFRWTHLRRISAKYLQHLPHLYQKEKEDPADLEI